MPFVEEKDITYLEGKCVDFNTEYPIFLSEIYLFLQKRWPEKYHQDLKPLLNGNIDDFNTKIGYPSIGAYHILDDSFTSCWDDIDILYNNSKSLFGYFYRIQLN